jgi:hypothetical protein
MSIEDTLTKFIENREGMNWSDAQDFAYEILELIENFTGEET